MRYASLTILGAVLLLLACGGGVDTIAEFPLNSLDSLIARSGVTLDEEVSSDGDGSIRIDAATAGTIPLFEVADPDVESATLIYEAKIRTENFQGMVYLEMLCRFPGRGEFFSRDLETPVSGDVDWSTEQTPFILRAGENPDLVKLNIGIAGTGTVWIDDIKLTKGPLQ